MLLVRRNGLLALDLDLALSIMSEALTSRVIILPHKGFDKSLNAATETEGLLLNVVIRKGESVLKLLVRKDVFVVLDLGLHIVHCVRTLNLEHDHLTCEGLDKDLHTTTEREDRMESRLLLDIVI